MLTVNLIPLSCSNSDPGDYQRSIEQVPNQETSTFNYAIPTGLK